jgi:hypothetical protein
VPKYSVSVFRHSNGNTANKSIYHFACQLIEGIRCGLNIYRVSLIAINVGTTQFCTTNDNAVSRLTVITYTGSSVLRFKTFLAEVRHDLCK